MPSLSILVISSPILNFSQADEMFIHFLPKVFLYAHMQNSNPISQGWQKYKALWKPKLLLCLIRLIGSSIFFVQIIKLIGKRQIRYCSEIHISEYFWLDQEQCGNLLPFMTRAVQTDVVIVISFSFLGGSYFLGSPFSLSIRHES